jgi:uncharacterized protein (UPF0333 family)
MPTKLKGMTSLEIAIIVAIVLVIAVAVGWYLYTTFVASTTTQGRLAISSAEYHLPNTLKLSVTNPGPQEVTITTVVLQGTKCGDSHSIKVRVGETKEFTANCSVSATPGTMLPGYIVTSVGTTFPFNAIVRQN